MWVDCNVHVEGWSSAQRITWAERAQAAQIEAAIWSGTDPIQWDLPNPERFPRAYGLHPLWVREETLTADLDQLESRIQALPSAVGEIGLDRRAVAPMAIQVRALSRQLHLAVQQRCAVILHVVRAHDLVFPLLIEHAVSRFMVHGFSGSPELARRYVDLGGVLGLGGLLSRQSPRLRETVRQLPLDSFVLESDAPDLPPQGARVSDPTDLQYTATLIAQLKGCDVQDVAQVTRATARRLFGDLLAQVD